MKSSKQFPKRAFSPITQKTIEVSDRKKKSSSNFHQITYKAKEFDPCGKSDKKRASNYLKDILKQPDSVNKYRIVTEPVDDRVITIVSSSFVPSKSKSKIDSQIANQRTRQTSLPKAQYSCVHCSKYSQEITFLQSELNKVMNQKSMWKNGQINLGQLRDSWGLSSPKLKSKQIQIKTIDTLLLDIKRNFCDLMRDIQSLTQIDYPKLLSQKIFNYTPTSNSSLKNSEQFEIKSLLGQIRQHYEGKVTSWDLQDQSEQSDHIKAILRNLKARLNHYLRQNLQLKAKKAILQKADQISAESQDYLRQIIEDVLQSYTSKI